MTPAQGVEDVQPGVAIPGRPPVPFADTSASGHPRKKKPSKVEISKKMYYTTKR